MVGIELFIDMLVCTFQNCHGKGEKNQSTEKRHQNRWNLHPNMESQTHEFI